MTINAFTSLLENPFNITENQNNELQNIVTKYPFFQAARAIQLKYLKDTKSYLYNDALKVTAAYTSDRNILFEFITSKQFTKNLFPEENTSIPSDSKPITEDAEKTSLELNTILKKEIKKAEAILDANLFKPKTEIPDLTEQLKINKPLPFQKGDTHSFTEWLKLTKAEPIKRETSLAKKQDKKEEKFDRIERFIQQKSKLTLPQKPTTITKNIDLSEPYTSTPTSLMTETLARVYLQQKNYNKAIQAYKILILKNPEKSGYFADQIRAIEKLINN